MAPKRGPKSNLLTSLCETFFANVYFFRLPFSSENRDLKHQDGRWRRVRHILVKAEAGPASRFTRLSMLSNITTATSRQVLEKISLRKYLGNKSSFAIARGELLVAYDEETVDNEEFDLLLKKNISRNPSFPYKHNEEFDFETMDPVQCKAEF